MKIIHFNDYQQMAGAETAIDKLRKETEVLGHKTYFFSRKNVIPFFGSERLKIIKCRYIIKKMKPDIIHLHNILGMGLAPFIAAKPAEHLSSKTTNGITFNRVKFCFK